MSEGVVSEEQIGQVLDALFEHLLSEQGSLTCAFVEALRSDLRDEPAGGWCKYDVRAIRARIEKAAALPTIDRLLWEQQLSQMTSAERRLAEGEGEK